jgi:hypothetical protein
MPGDTIAYILPALAGMIRNHIHEAEKFEASKLQDKADLEIRAAASKLASVYRRCDRIDGVKFDDWLAVASIPRTLRAAKVWAQAVSFGIPREYLLEEVPSI